jgi:hypothetical protein
MSVSASATNETAEDAISFVKVCVEDPNVWSRSHVQPPTIDLFIPQDQKCVQTGQKMKSQSGSLESLCSAEGAVEECPRSPTWLKFQGREDLSMKTVNMYSNELHHDPLHLLIVSSSPAPSPSPTPEIRPKVGRGGGGDISLDLIFAINFLHLYHNFVELLGKLWYKCSIQT